MHEPIGQTRRQVAGFEVQKEAARCQSGLIVQELEAQRFLSDRGLTGLPEFLRLERAAAGLGRQADDV